MGSDRHGRYGGVDARELRPNISGAGARPEREKIDKGEGRIS